MNVDAPKSSPINFILVVVILILIAVLGWALLNPAQDPQLDLQAEVDQLKNTNQQLEEQVQRLTDSLKQFDQQTDAIDPNEVEHLAHGVFRRLDERKSLESELQIWLETEVGSLEEEHLHDDVLKKVESWIASFAGLNPYRIQFDKKAMGDGLGNAYIIVTVGDTQLARVDELGVVDLEWKPGQPISVKIGIDGYLYDTTVFERKYQSRYAIWELHRDGLQATGSLKDEPQKIRFQVNELMNETRYPKRRSVFKLGSRM